MRSWSKEHVTRDAIDDGVARLARIGGLPKQGQASLKAQAVTPLSPAPEINKGPWVACSATWVEPSPAAAWVVSSAGAWRTARTFKQNGQEDAADSWVSKGPNKELAAPQLEQAIGADVSAAALEQQTGLSQEELLARLSRELPNSVDKYTPDGRVPS
jgi:uncharacterized protein YidB (DUF937 family)